MKEYQIRREMIDSLDVIGYKTSEIVRILLKENLLKKSKNPYVLIKSDLKIVRARRKENLYTGEADKIRAEYIGQQIEILKRALRNKDHRASIEASKNIAKARGISVEEVLKIEMNVEGGIKEISDEELNRRIGRIEARTVAAIEDRKKSKTGKKR